MAASWRGLSAGLLATLLLCAGCGDGPDDSAATGASVAPRAATPESPPPSAPPAVRGGEEGDVPADHAGPLTNRSLPAPAELGAGWQPRVSAGGHEEGFSGNGTWTQERDPQDVLVGITPLGCGNELPRPKLPAPAWALDGLYGGRSGDSAAGLALEFASDAEAAQFLRGLATVLRACGDSATEPPNTRISVLSATDTALVDLRRDPETPARVSTEVMVRDGKRVALLTLDQRAAVQDVAGLQDKLLTALRR